MSSSSSSSSSRARLAREIADAWTGVPYRIGGTTAAGIGNTEFVREVYSALFDAELEGNVQAWAKAGRSVAIGDLQPGDIVFYDFRGVGQVASQRHAGVYVGEGEFIAAVRESAVTVARLADSRWRRVYKGAVRIDLEGPKGTEGPIVQADRVSPMDAVALRPDAAADPALRLREIAERWRGTPYRFGGTSRDGIDCSAFSSMLYRTAFNVELPRTTEDQERLGVAVERRKLQAGDLVFFRIRGMGPGERSGHVGVYLGGGQFAQASESQGVTISSLHNEYWSRRYFSARRPPAPTALTLLVDETSTSRRIGRP